MKRIYYLIISAGVLFFSLQAHAQEEDDKEKTKEKSKYELLQENLRDAKISSFKVAENAQKAEEEDQKAAELFAKAEYLLKKAEDKEQNVKDAVAKFANKFVEQGNLALKTRDDYAKKASDELAQLETDRQTAINAPNAKDSVKSGETLPPLKSSTAVFVGRDDVPAVQAQQAAAAVALLGMGSTGLLHGLSGVVPIEQNFPDFNQQRFSDHIQEQQQGAAVMSALSGTAGPLSALATIGAIETGGKIPGYLADAPNAETIASDQATKAATVVASQFGGTLPGFSMAMGAKESGLGTNPFASEIASLPERITSLTFDWHGGANGKLPPELSPQVLKAIADKNAQLIAGGGKALTINLNQCFGATCGQQIADKTGSVVKAGNTLMLVHLRAPFTASTLPGGTIQTFYPKAKGK